MADPEGAPATARGARACVVAVALVSFLASAAVARLLPESVPSVNDEWSYLLAADTFLHGRLANPPHPAWRHFETFHVIHAPTYASRYPPGQGLFLAVGRLVSGSPQVGVWLSVALFAAATSWLALAFLPARWAALAGLLAWVRFGVAAGWGASYWGGAVAALGGALAFGALARVLRAPRAGDAVWLATGLALLANTRPYEGFVVALPIAAALAAFAIGRLRAGAPRPLLRSAAVFALASALGAAATLRYDAAVTGSATSLPWQVYQRTYSSIPFFPWQPLRPAPEYGNPQMREFHQGWELSFHRAWRDPRERRAMFEWKLAGLWRTHLGVAFSLALAALPLAWRRREVRFAIAVLALELAATLVATFGGLPHYVAPVSALVVALAVIGLHDALRARRRIGAGLVALVVLIAVGEAALAVRERRAQPPGFGELRAQRQRQLEELPGRDLVFVRYGPEHNPHYEWVVNLADIDAQEVVWARELGPEADRALAARYPDRRVWLLHVVRDGAPPLLTPHPLSTAPGS